MTSTNATVTTLASTTGTITNLFATTVEFDNLNVDNIIINNAPTVDSHATRKDYVDTTATALAIALGA